MTLFWRIFLTFWVTLMVLMTLASVGLSQVAKRDGLEPADRQRVLEQRLRGAAALVERSGIRPLRRWLPRNGVIARSLFIVDESGQSHRGSQPPAFLIPLIEQARGASDVVTIKNAGSAIAVEHRGQVWTLLVATRRPGKLLQITWQGTLLRLLFAGLVSGATAWLLSRHIARPVLELRRLSDSLAKGDLSARASVANRRTDELGQLARDLDRMAARLELAHQSQQRLLADTSHELRSPIARLQVAVELARQRSGGAAAQELDRVEEESNRLNTMIGLVLQLARDRQTPASVEEIDLQQMMGEIVEDTNFECNRAAVVLASSSPAVAAVIGDPDQLRSAFENVVRNAAIHGAAAPPAEVSVSASSGWVSVVCRDYGPGVSEADLPHLLEPFYTARNAPERSGGHGIGLAIVAAAIEAHSGEFTVKNAAPNGFIAEIRLPMSA